MGQSFEDLLQAMPDIAKVVNGFTNEAAQQRALDALLDAFFGRELEVPDELDSKGESSAGAEGTRSSGDGMALAWQKRLITEMPNASQVSGKDTNRDYQAMWAILTLWERGEEANTSSILKAVKEELGIGPERNTNLADRLKGWTPKYVTRRKSGRGFAYEPTSKALEVFGGLSREGE